MARNDQPRPLPADLLANAAWQRACRERDFAQIFKLVKLKAGIYPSRIAALCGMTPSRVGEILSGRRRLAHIDVIERVADGLRIPGAMLGLAHRPWEIPTTAGERAPAPRQEPTEPTTSVLSPQSSSTAGLDELIALVDGQVSRSTLTALRSSVEDYWRRDDEHGGAPLRPAVLGHLRYVTELTGQTDNPDLKRELQTVAAELARLAGWAYFDARQYSTARRYFTQALGLARELGDRMFLANVLSCMSLQATYESAPTEAVALACRAQDAARLAGNDPLVMAMLHMREAFAHATLRDAAACRRAIDAARDHFGQARHHRSDAPTWVRYFDETKLIVDTGIALGQLGDATHAEPLIAEGLRRERTDQQRGRAFHAFWLARTQLDQGKLDQACHSAGTALELTAAIDSPRVAGHVRDFHHQLAPYAREPSVIAFEQRMRDTLS